MTKSSEYQHTQAGWVILVFLGLSIAAVSVVVVLARGSLFSVGVLIALMILLAMSGFLTVKVTDSNVRIRFGMGPIAKNFPVASIRKARIVRNPWYYGWGIRWFPGGWLFNVSGLRAVELVMSSGRLYRIGSDEPKKLLAAINRARGTGPGSR